MGPPERTEATQAVRFFHLANGLAGDQQDPDRPGTKSSSRQHPWLVSKYVDLSGTETADRVPAHLLGGPGRTARCPAMPTQRRELTTRTKCNPRSSAAAHGNAANSCAGQAAMGACHRDFRNRSRAMFYFPIARASWSHARPLVRQESYASHHRSFSRRRHLGKRIDDKCGSIFQILWRDHHRQPVIGGETRELPDRGQAAEAEISRAPEFHAHLHEEQAVASAFGKDRKDKVAPATSRQSRGRGGLGIRSMMEAWLGENRR